MPAMQWLIHGSVLPAVKEALLRHEHKAQTVLDAGLPADAGLQDVLKVARQKQLDIITNDPDLAQAPFETKFWLGRCIVYLQLEGGDVEQDDAIDRFFARYKRPAIDRLYTVTASRVKVRQLPAKR